MDDLSKDLIIKKQKMIKNLNKKIKSDERKIEFYSIYSAQINCLRRLKILIKIEQLIIPYVLAAGITTGIFSSFGRIPFYRDNYKQSLETMKKIDSLGNTKYEEQYEGYDNAVNMIFYYSKWIKESDGLFYRNVYTYNVKNMSEKKIVDIVNGKFDNIDDILGKPININKEIKEDITEEELNSNGLIEGIIYSKSKDNFILVKETVNSNVFTTLLCVLCVMILEYFIDGVRMYFNIDYKKMIKDINDKNQPKDINELIKIMEINKNNYERLMRK